MPRRVIRQYEFVRKIGSGGSGVVFLANDTLLQRPVVLKLLKRGAQTAEQIRVTQLREARLASAIDHPNVCAIYEVGEADDEAYIIHFGIVVMFIGLAGAAFNQSKELEVGFGDTLQIGSWRLVCNSYSQDTNPNFDTDYALLDVFHGNKLVTKLTPERRFYNASQQNETRVAIHSTLARDLYVVFEGRNPETDRPIIKVFMNPLVNWIWIGVFIVIGGTAIALVPPLKPATRKVTAESPAHMPGATPGVEAGFSPPSPATAKGALAPGGVTGAQNA